MTRRPRAPRKSKAKPAAITLDVVEGVAPDTSQAEFSALLATAIDARRLGDFTAALNAVQAARLIRPTDVGACIEEARALTALERPADAEQVLDDLLAAASRPVWALVEKAHLRRRAQDLATSAALFREASDGAPDLPDLRVELARDLDALGRKAEALAVLDEALILSPTHFWALAAKGQILVRMGDHARAAETLAVAATANPRHIEIGLDLARELLASGDPDRAAREYRRLMLAAPNRPEPAAGLAHCLLELGRDADAEALFRVVNDVSPGRQDVIVALSRLSQARGETFPVWRYFENVVASDATRVAAALSLAAEFQHRGAMQDAADLLNAMLGKLPEHFGAHLQLGRLERARGRHVDAGNAFRRAAELRPDDTQAAIELAREQWALGDPAQALSTLKDTLALHPDDLSALLVSAEYAMAADDAAAAVAYTAQAIAKDPEALDAYLVGARAEARRLDFGAAKGLLLAAQDRFGARPQILATRIHILRQNREHEEARAVAELAAEAAASNFGLWNERTSLLITLGEFDAADQALEAPPSGSFWERARVNILKAQHAEGRRDYAQGIHFYQAAMKEGQEEGGWHGELARCHLLMVETDRVRVELGKAITLDRSAYVMNRQSLNISQHHVGQMLDEFILDGDALTELKAIALVDSAAQIPHLEALVKADPDLSAPAILLMLALRRAGRLTPSPADKPRLQPQPIPRTIAQFWNDTPPDDIAAIMATWPAANPGYEYTLFDDQTARAFITENHPPSLLQAYQRAQHPAQKADLFRLAYLAVRGGFYVDADDKCLTPLDKWITPNADLILYQEIYATIGNNFMGVRPGHPVIARALELAAMALLRGDHDNIWLSTGPGLVTRALAQVISEDTHEPLLATSQILELWEAQRVIGIHCPARYKATKQHWSRAGAREAAAIARVAMSPAAPADAIEAKIKAQDTPKTPRSRRRRAR